MNEYDEKHYIGADYHRLVYGRNAINMSPDMYRQLYMNEPPKSDKKDLQSTIPCIITIRPKYDLADSIEKIMQFLPARYHNLFDKVSDIDVYEKHSHLHHWDEKTKHLHIKADEIYLTDNHRVSFKSEEGVKYKRVKFGTLLSEYKKQKSIINLDLFKVSNLNLL